MNTTWSAFFEELTKVAALTPDEEDMLRAAIRRQAKFEQQSVSGKMDPVAQKAMRDNIERIKAFKAKSRGDVGSIPRWAKSPGGVPPPPPPRSTGNYGTQTVRPPDIVSLVMLGAAGAQLGMVAGAMKDLGKTPRQKEREKRESGPIGRWAIDNPTRYGGLVGAISTPMAFMAPSILKNPTTAKALGASIIGAYAAPAALGIVDRGLKWHEDNKKAANG